MCHTHSFYYDASDPSSFQIDTCKMIECKYALHKFTNFRVVSDW